MATVREDSDHLTFMAILTTKILLAFEEHSLIPRQPTNIVIVCDSNVTLASKVLNVLFVVGDALVKFGDLRLKASNHAVFFLNGSVKACDLFGFHFVQFVGLFCISLDAANLILRWLGVEMVPEHQQVHNEEEIRMLVAQSHKSGIIDQTELALFDKIFEFADRVAREVMIPRVDMVCLYTHNRFEQNLNIIKESQYTRYPLCGKDKDDIRGIVHVREVFEHLLEGESPDLIRLARPAILIPETMEIKDALRILQKNRAGMAIVVDEYGGTAGLLTTEDIVEEIVGEIQDEFDDERPFFQNVEGGTSIDARLLIEEVNDYFGTDIEDPDNDTIGGWVFSRLKEVPRIGDEVRHNGWIFTVQEIDQRSVTRLLVKPEKKAAEGNLDRTN